MKKLKILQVTNRIPWPLNDGGNIATYNVAKFLSKAGHEVVLASLNTSKHWQDPAELKDIGEVHAVDIDTTVRPLGMLKGLFSLQPYNVTRFRSNTFRELLQKLLVEHEFDLIQLEGSYLSIYIRYIRRVSRVPIVLRSHNVEHKIWERLAENEENGLKSWYCADLAAKIRRFELSHLDHYEAIIPIAAQDEDFYRQHRFRGLMRTINGGVDLDVFKPSSPPAFSTRICFLGSLEWLPNVQGLNWFLSEVWPSIHRQHPELELHVAGKNPQPGMDSLNVPGMKFYGTVPDAAKFMDACHFFIVPLLSGGGMRLKIVEAMANGKAVISTTIGAEGIACIDGKQIFLADTEHEWIKTFNILMESPELSVEAGVRALALARSRYGWEAIAGQFEDFYQELLA